MIPKKSGRNCYTLKEIVISNKELCYATFKILCYPCLAFSFIIRPMFLGLLSSHPSKKRQCMFPSIQNAALSSKAFTLKLSINCMKMAAVVKNVQQTTKFSSSFSFSITFQLDWLIISCNSRWKLSRSEFATAARTYLGLRLELGDRDLGWALRLLLGLSVELCNVTLQHSHWTLLNVASRRWLDTSNCSNQILCSICILRFLCISSFLHYSFFHFYILLLHFPLSLELLFLFKFFYFYISHLHLQLARMRHAQGWRTIRVIYLAYLEQYILYTHTYIYYIYCKVAGLAAIKLN